MKQPLFKDKTVAVIGFGVEGESVIKFLEKQNAASITVFEEKKSAQDIESQIASRRVPVSVVIGKLKDLAGFDVIIVSPGIRFDHPVLEEARRHGVVVTTGTNIFMDLVPCKTIGVTGTKGKGTTSSLIVEMLKNDGIDAYLGGNIGTAPLDFLDKLKPESVVVLELSSFQLSSITKSPDIAVIVMVTSEHLDYHKDTEEYVMSKAGIVTHQTPRGEVIANIDYPNSVVIANASKKHYWQVSGKHIVMRGTYVTENTVYWTDGKETEKIVETKEIFIPGKHNWENVCAAVSAAKIAGVSLESIKKTIKTFRGLPHRIELVREFDGVKFYDDSFSTTPETAIAAIASFNQPKILILGGSGKNSDFTKLGRTISQCPSLRAIIGIGLEWKRIKETIHNVHLLHVIEGCKTMTDIVNAALNVVELGDVVLLTPACASFDMFRNYKDRGDQFKKCVLRLGVGE